VEVPDSESNRIGDEITIIAWVKPLGANGKCQDIVRRHFILGWVNKYNYNDWRCWIWDGSSWRAFNYPEPLSNYVNKWVFTAFTYSYGGKARVWVNNNYAEYDALWKPKLRASNWGIGWGGSDYPFEYFNGVIDEVRIYNRALSEEEIKYLFCIGAYRLQQKGEFTMPSWCNSYLKTYSYHGNDYRFAYADGNKLPYWREEGNDKIYWVKVDNIPANGDKNIYFYYGNPSANYEGNGDDVFIFFDNFDDGKIDNKKWYVDGSPAENNGYLILNGSRADKVKSTSKFGPYNISVISRVSTNLGHFRAICVGNYPLEAIDFAIYPSTTTAECLTGNDGTYTQHAGIGISNTQLFKKFEIDWLPSKVKFIQDSIPRHEITTNIPDSALDVGVCSWWSGEISYVDYILVRKYADSEPTITIGSEEYT
jgi:hypothetical protein